MDPECAPGRHLPGRLRPAAGMGLYSCSVRKERICSTTPEREGSTFTERLSFCLLSINTAGISSSGTTPDTSSKNLPGWAVSRKKPCRLAFSSSQGLRPAHPMAPCKSAMYPHFLPEFPDRNSVKNHVSRWLSGYDSRKKAT